MIQLLIDGYVFKLFFHQIVELKNSRKVSEIYERLPERFFYPGRIFERGSSRVRYNQK